MDAKNPKSKRRGDSQGKEGRYGDSGREQRRARQNEEKGQLKMGVERV